MKLLFLALLFATLQTCAQAEKIFPVNTHDVAQALLQRNLAVTDDQVQLVANIVTDGPEPVLDVESAQLLSVAAADQRIRAKIKLSCRRPNACLPFYAVVSWPMGTSLSSLPALSQPLAAHTVPPPLSIRAGDAATLMVDSGQMRMTLPVISLQNGAIGSRIHVTSQDRKQTYIATIISATLLKGSL